MVNWIDEPDDEEDEDEGDEVYEAETFNCPFCNSSLTFDESDFCPVCGSPLDADAPDAEAVDALERCGDEYAGA